MKYIKKFENRKIIYSVGDIVTCKEKETKFSNFMGYIDQNGVHQYEKNGLVYGKKYKILDIMYYSYYNLVNHIL